MVGAFNGFSSAANRIENVPAPYFLFPSVASPTFFPRARRSARPLAVPSNKTEPYMESIDLQDRSWSVERKWEIALVLLRRAHFPSKKETSLWRLIGKRQTVGDGPKRIRWRTELERCDLSDIINVRLFFRPTTVERIELGSHTHTHTPDVGELYARPFQQLKLDSTNEYPRQTWQTIWFVVENGKDGLASVAHCKIAGR